MKKEVYTCDTLIDAKAESDSKLIEWEKEHALRDLGYQWAKRYATEEVTYIYMSADGFHHPFKKKQRSKRLKLVSIRYRFRLDP